MRAGIQISSFKSLMTSETELDAVLRSMRGFGCDVTQLQWIDKSVPSNVICALLHKHGIAADSVQEKADAMIDDFGYFADLADTCGLNDICISGIPQRFASVSGVAAYASVIRELSERSGKAFSYHPTGNDLKDGCFLCERLLDEMPELRLCADTCQLTDSGNDPAAFIARHAGRIDIVHFKNRDESGKLTVVGKGRTDLNAAAKACADSGVLYVLAEQEGGTIEELKEGFVYVQNLLQRL